MAKNSKWEFLKIQDEILRSIIYFREIEKKQWKEIAKNFKGYTPESTRKIYERYKKANK